MSISTVKVIEELKTEVLKLKTEARNQSFLCNALNKELELVNKELATVKLANHILRERNTELENEE